MAAKNILVVPTDFSERSLTALAWVRKMAEAMQADIRCIYVVEEPQIYSTLDMGPVAIPSVTELVKSAEHSAAVACIEGTLGPSTLPTT